MPSPQTNGHDKTYDYTPVDYDVNTVPPRCNPGRYQAKVAASQKPTNAEKLPMLVLAWTIEAIADDQQDNEQFVGATVTDYLVIRAEGDPKGRMHKIRLRTLLERLELSYDLVPKRIETKSDLEELVAALNDHSLSIGITVKKNEETGEDRENINYMKPRDQQASADGDFEEPTETPRRAAPASRKAAPARGGKTTSKSSRR